MFGGEARFAAAHITGNAEFAGAEFKSRAVFDRLRVDGSAFFRTDDRGQRVTFGGDARFHGVRIAGNAEFDGAEFKRDAGFDNCRIDGAAFFRPDAQGNRLIFQSRARFPSASFATDTQFTRAGFLGPTDFNNAHFLGAARFDYAEFSASEKSFNGARFERGAYFQFAQFGGEIDFGAATADRDVQFSGARFSGAISFREARFHSVFFGTVTREGKQTWWPRPLPWKEPNLSDSTCWAGNVDFRGFTYERIYVYLPDLFPRLGPFDRQPYSQLEAALRIVGDEQRARRVYFERRRQEHKRKFLTGRFLAWVFDWVYRIVANCGVAPLQLILFAAALIALGAHLFAQPGALEPVKKDPGQTLVSCSPTSFQ